jgi:hypothetical protein
MSEKYTIYRILAKPGVGYIRAYVGALRTQDWGQTPAEATTARAEAHLDASSGTSAAWLRPCTERLEAVPIGTGTTLVEAHALELYHTLRTMDNQGELAPAGPLRVRRGLGP